MISIRRPLRLIATMNNNSAIVQELINYGANIVLQDSYDNTAMMYAVKNNNINLVKILFAADAKKSYKYLKNKDGQSKKIQFIQDNQAIIDLLKGLYA